MAAVIFGVLALASYIACYKLSTERIVAKPKAKGEKSNIKVTLKALGKNKPLIAIFTASLLFMCCSMLIGTVNAYLFKDYFQNTTALAIYGFVSTGITLLIIPMAAPIVRKYGKKEMSTVGLAIATIAYTALYFIPNITATGFVIGTGIGMFGISLFNIVIWAFVTDVIDYHEYLTGLREDGTIYSIYSMARKIGQAVAGGLGGAAIAGVGYQAGAAAQSAETLKGIFGLATLVPAGVYLTMFLIVAFAYPLTKQRLSQLSVDLVDKRNAKKAEEIA